MPISVTCPDCGKSYRVKDDLAGKKFKCKQCEAIIAVPFDEPRQASKPRRKTTGLPRQSAQSQTKQRQSVPKRKSIRKKTSPSPQKPTRRPRSAPAAESYDDYDDYDDYGSAADYADEAYGFDDDFGAKPKRKKKGATAGKSAKRNKQRSGLAFNINRFNVAMIVGGVMLLFWGAAEWRLSLKSGAKPTSLNLSEIVKNGIGDHVYVTIHGMLPVGDGQFVYEQRRSGNYSKIWYPVVPGEAGALSPKVVVYSASASNDSAVRSLMLQSTQTGMIVNSIQSLDRETKKLLQDIRGVNPDSVLIFHSGRKPAGPIKYLGLVLLGLALLGGGVFWIFLTGR